MNVETICSAWRDASRGRAAARGLGTALALTMLAGPRAHAQQPLAGGSDITRSVLEALAHSNLELAALRGTIATARSRLEGAGLAPPAVLSGEIEEVPGGLDLGRAGVRLEVGRQFLTGGRSAAARAVAAADVQVAEAQFYAAEQRIRRVAVAGLAEAIGWSAIARRLAAEDTILTGAESALRVQFTVGASRYTDVLRLRTERLRAQADRADALARAQVAIGTLEGLLGGASADGLALHAVLSSSSPTASLAGLPSSPPDPDSLVAFAGAVRVARAEVERAHAAEAFAEAERRPRIAAALGAQRVDAQDGGFAVGPTLGFSLSLPFTARRANRAEAESAARDVAAAEAGLEAVRSSSHANLTLAHIRYQAAHERLATFDTALLMEVRQEREAALTAYRSGDLSLIELLDLERAIARAEIEQERARIDAASALAELTYAAAVGDDAISAASIF